MLIVLNELFLYPVFHRCCSCVTSIHKFLLGIVIQIATFLTLMIFEILSQQGQWTQRNHFMCTLLRPDRTLVISFNYNWMVLPDCLYDISLTLTFVGGLEFIFAQVPYAMKGIILGVAVCSVVSSIEFNIAILKPLQHKMSIWTGIISCGFWYVLVHMVSCTIGCIATTIITKHYTKRKREDVLPNKHIFAEWYYDK